MTTLTLHLRLLDIHGDSLTARDLPIGPGESAEIIIPADQAARLAAVRISAAPFIGSPGATGEYRKTALRELAEDQFRRGLDEAGAWDATIARCHQISLSPTAECNLRRGHTGLHEQLDPTQPRQPSGYTWGASAAQQAATAAEIDRLHHGLAAADDRNCG